MQPLQTPELTLRDSFIPSSTWLWLTRSSSSSYVAELGGPREKLCDTCIQVVTAAHTILTDQEVANDLIAIVEQQVCGHLPEGEAKTKVSV